MLGGLVIGTSPGTLVSKPMTKRIQKAMAHELVEDWKSNWLTTDKHNS